MAPDRNPKPDSPSPPQPSTQALESRYKLHEGGEVWQEELVHRNVNDVSTLLPQEAPHPHLAQSVAAERSEQSFTRVLVTSIKVRRVVHGLSVVPCGVPFVPETRRRGGLYY